ncbi:MAG: bifunctional diaminohydroxyphosphoribosylaminopyrimidine deaminase/5-amino-6-(5-phosphoribosylamino)uracil reductase RibD [Pseudomonadota bacterium]
MSDARWMASALALARRSLGRTWPNPAVGCLIVRGGRLLARGHTAPGGRPHAETEALARAQAAGHETSGATAYVTLEPCAHHGKTPPCVDALITAGISRVVCPLEDPDPRVAGRGFAALRTAGLSVDVGCLAAEARELNAGFLSRIECNRPLVTLKLAATLDGRIATRTGESRWITGPAARRLVHLMRAEHDAVLIGAGTARADNPMLDVRGLGLASKPVRIVADSSLSLPLTGRLAATAGDQPLWVLHRTGAPADRAAALRGLGVETIEIETQDDRLSMPVALRALGGRGMTRILCEGGGQIAASLLSAGLVDQISLFSAGKVIGGDGLTAIGGFGLTALAEAPSFQLSATRPIGADTLSTWLPTQVPGS